MKAQQPDQYNEIMDKDCKLDFKPTKEVFDYLMESLLNEGIDSLGNGLSNNKSHIQYLYENGFFVSFLLNDRPIGFATGKKHLNTAAIDYFWIEPNSRKKGLGKLFQTLLNRALIRRRIYMVLIEAVTPGGQKLSKNIGFKLLKETDYAHAEDVHIKDGASYLFLKTKRDSYSTPKNQGYELLIWPTRANNGAPSQCYTLDENLTKRPILAIVNIDAYFELRRDGVSIKHSDLRYFFRKRGLNVLQREYFLCLTKFIF